MAAGQSDRSVGFQNPTFRLIIRGHVHVLLLLQHQKTLLAVYLTRIVLLHHWLLQQSLALLFTRLVSHLHQMERLTSGSSRMRVFIMGEPQQEVSAPPSASSSKHISSRRLNSVPLRVFSILSPFRTSFCTCELKLSDLCGFICECETFPPSCPPLSLYSSFPSAFQGLCVFWRSENNNSGSSRAQLSIYQQKLLTQVPQLDRK